MRDTPEHHFASDDLPRYGREHESFLSEKEMQTPRGLEEFISWYHGKFETYGDDEKFSEAVRFRLGPFKQFIEEASFIVKMLEKYDFCQQGVKIRHVIGSQSYDAEVVYENDHGVSAPKYLEVTDSTASEDEFHRMLVLSRTGMASAWGPLSKSGSKNKGLVISLEPKFLSEEERRLAVNTVIRAINRKIEKSDKYPEGTALIVGVDDNLLFKDDDWEFLDERVRRYCSLLSGFTHLFLVGASRDRFLFYELSALNGVE